MSADKLAEMREIVIVEDSDTIIEHSLLVDDAINIEEINNFKKSIILRTKSNFKFKNINDSRACLIM